MKKLQDDKRGKIKGYLISHILRTIIYTLLELPFMNMNIKLDQILSINFQYLLTLYVL